MSPYLCIQVDDGLEIKAYYAGHVLGAAMFQIRVGQHTIVYTVISPAGGTRLPLLAFFGWRHVTEHTCATDSLYVTRLMCVIGLTCID